MLNNILDPLTEIFRTQNQDFYLAYHHARNIIDDNGGNNLNDELENTENQEE